MKNTITLIIKTINILLPLTLLYIMLPIQSYGQFTAKWDNGYKIESNDKQFKLKFGGRIMYDVLFFPQIPEPSSKTPKSGVEFRRVRLFNSGQIYNNVKYKLQVDFAGGKVGVKDMYIEIIDIPLVGSFKTGYFKEPIRLESLTSSKYITFMERSFPAEFLPTRNTGMMIQNYLYKKQVSWQFAFFRNADNGDDKDANGDYNLTGRIAGYFDINTNAKIHLGLGYSYRKKDEFDIELRPENHLSDKYLNTGIINNVNETNVISLEASHTYGSFSLQAEYISAMVNADKNYNFYGYYAMASYFLTGEKRKYKSPSSGYDRIKPNSNFGNGGLGALQIAIRYSSIDLNDNDITGGQANNYTIGINWYLNPSTRIMFNYLYSDLSVNNLNGALSTASIRFQVDF